MKTRTIEIIFESSEVLVIEHRGRIAKAWCALCDRQVGMISLEEAGEAGLTTEAICKRADAGQLHLIEPGGGLSFLCLNSLVQTLGQKPLGGTPLHSGFTR